MNNIKKLKLMSSIIVRMATIHDIKNIITLKRRIFGVSLPWGEHELFSQINTFQEGQIVAINTKNGEVVGALGTLVISSSEYSLLAHWGDLTGNGTFRNHNLSLGDTLFRSHLIVDPRFDREMLELLGQAELGIASMLGLSRIRAGVRFMEYYLFHHLAPAEYFEQVEMGTITDDWITLTLNRGFRPLALVTEYFPKDLRSEGYAMVAQLDSWHGLRCTYHAWKKEWMDARQSA